MSGTCEALAPILFDDHERAAGAAERSSIVAPARRSTAARHKAAHKRTADALPVLSFRSLLGELATFSRNTMAVADAPEDTFLLYPQRTALQTRTFELLGVSARADAVNHMPRCDFPNVVRSLRPERPATSD